MASPHSSSISRFARLLMLALILAVAAARPAAAQSVLRDSETELLFRDISRPLITAAGLDPKATNVALLNDPEINAFVATGQTVYIQSGLLVAADNVNQLQGVIAHELGHVAGGHSIRIQDGSNEATGISLATLVLGALAIAAGAGDAGMGIMMAGQRAAIGRFLAFSRTQESSADSAGAKYLSAAGISGKGSIEFFKKLAESGNLIATAFSPAQLASGELPITLRWDYNSLAWRDANKDSATIEVVYPKSGTVAGVYLTAISAYAPRPYAARLWAEYLYSDEGQLTWLSGYAKPVRFDDLVKRNVIPQELLDKLPKADVSVAFPTLDQLQTGLQYIRDHWASDVGITYAS